jgi:hypothetical protein
MRYRNTSPKWVKAKFNNTCQCGKPINKGDDVLYYPAFKRCNCKECSEQHQRDMDANSFDESVYNY